MNSEDVWWGTKQNYAVFRVCCVVNNELWICSGPSSLKRLASLIDSSLCVKSVNEHVGWLMWSH